MPDKLITIQNVRVWLPQTQTWIYSQLQYLLGSIESHVVCENTENLDQFPWPSIHCLADGPNWKYVWQKGLRKLGLRRYLPFLVREARRLKGDLLHSHFGHVGWANIKAAQKAGLKHVVTFYGRDVNQYPIQNHRWYARYRELFTTVDLVLCEGSFMAQSIAALGCSEEKIAVHHLGVGVDQIPFKPRKWNPGKPLRILIASTFREKKGIQYGIEAIGQLQHKFPVEVTIIGDATDEPKEQREKAAIITATEKHHLKRKVRFLGFQPHSVMLEEAYRHHIFLSPSITASDGDSEGGAPVSLIEMAATGMPIVSTTHCDIPEVIHHGETGLLAPERNAAILAEHLLWWANHPNQWLEMLLTGRRHIESEYDAMLQGRRLAEHYLLVMGH